MAKLILNHDYQVQKYGWNCGPTAARTALSTEGVFLSQDQIIAEINGKLPRSSWVDDDGTDAVGLLEPVLDAHSSGAYSVFYPKASQFDRFWSDVRGSIAGGRGVVANIVAPAGDHPPGYPGYTIYHYIAVVGFDDNGQQFYIADSANFSGITHYWLTAKQLLRLISGYGKGYAYGPPPVVALDATTVNKFRANFMSAISSDAKDVREQFHGAGSRNAGQANGWVQLGGRTVESALEAIWAAVNG